VEKDFRLEVETSNLESRKISFKDSNVFNLVDFD
jgi:hypothetical protein